MQNEHAVSNILGHNATTLSHSGITDRHWRLALIVRSTVWSIVVGGGKQYSVCPSSTGSRDQSSENASVATARGFVSG